MTPCIEEAHRLLRIAERDLQTLHILSTHPEAALAALGFHAQQCVEKSLKAALTTRGVDFPPTHNLEKLAGLAIAHGLNLPIQTRELRKLNPFAVETRYNDEAIELLSREEASRIAEQTLIWAGTIVTQAGA